MGLVPKNWATFQHYKDRKPPWIKLHHALLDNYEFFRLPVASRALAPCLWLLASEYKGGIITASYDEIAFRVRMPLSELLVALKPLVDSGFFSDNNDVAECYSHASIMLAERKQLAMPETERETERETESEITTSSLSGAPKPAPTTRGSRLPVEWQPSNGDAEFAHKLLPQHWRIEVDKFRDYWHARAGPHGVKLDWSATWRNWLRKVAEQKGFPSQLQLDRPERPKPP